MQDDAGIRALIPTLHVITIAPRQAYIRILYKHAYCVVNLNAASVRIKRKKKLTNWCSTPRNYVFYSCIFPLYLRDLLVCSAANATHTNHDSNTDTSRYVVDISQVGCYTPTISSYREPN